MKGAQIRAWKSGKLSQLTGDMKSCALDSEHTHHKADIISKDTLKNIIMRFPSYLQA